MPLSSEKRQPRISTSDSGPLPLDLGMAARLIRLLIPFSRPSRASSIFPPCWYAAGVKFTRYYHEMRKRPDRAFIRQEWVQQAVDHPIRQVVQLDGRIRRWAAITAMGGQYLRVVLLPDGETVHNAFFDRSFKP